LFTCTRSFFLFLLFWWKRTVFMNAYITVKPSLTAFSPLTKTRAAAPSLKIRLFYLSTKFHKMDTRISSANQSLVNWYSKNLHHKRRHSKKCKKGIWDISIHKTVLFHQKIKNKNERVHVNKPYARSVTSSHGTSSFLKTWSEFPQLWSIKLARQNESVPLK